MMKRQSVALLSAGVAALYLSMAPINAGAAEVVLDDNPALQALMDEDPAKGQAVMEEIDRLMKLPVARNLFQPPKGEKGKLLIENPALKETYRRDPKATSKLLSTLLPVPN